MYTIMNGEVALINGFAQVWVFPTREAAEAWLAAHPGTPGEPREARCPDMAEIIEDIAAEAKRVRPAPCATCGMTQMSEYASFNAKDICVNCEEAALNEAARHTEDEMVTCIYSGELFFAW